MATPTTVRDLLAGAKDPYLRADLSPDRRHAVVISMSEMRMSHWIEHGALYTVADERLVAEIGPSLWSIDRLLWAPDGAGLTLWIRRYPGDVPGVSVEIAVDHLTACVNGHETQPLDRLSDWLEADYVRRGGRG